MNKFKVLILITLTTSTWSICKAQGVDLVTGCSELISSMYEEQFNYEGIQTQLSKFRKLLEKSTLEEYQNCNCADSLWVLNWKSQYHYLKNSPTKSYDTIQLLTNIIHDIDIMNLETELRFSKSKTLIDSFNYVVKRLGAKISKEKYIYFLITAELDFLKANKFLITDRYFELVDNKETDPEIVDVIFLSLFNSNNHISNKVKSRIGKQQYEKHFYRMYGIINTSSSDEFPINQTDILKSINYRIEEEKVNYIITSFYKYKSNDLRKLKRKQKRRIRAALTNPYLETMESAIKLMNDLK
jgi:hypothetical protein